MLALSAGRRVSTDRLVDLVWDENPSESARDEQRSASLTVQDEIDAARAERGWVEVGRALQPGLPDGYWQPVDD